jgi:DNA-directed RNA polymerase specialized sigma24 family protein
MGVMTSSEPRTWHAAVLQQVRGAESALREALVGGDEAQLERFVAQRYVAMKRIAACAPDPSEAEALVQQALVDFCGELAAAQDGLSLDAQLFGCVVRRVRARAVELGAREPFDEDEPLAPAVASERFRGDEHRWAGGWVEPPRPFALEPTVPATVAELQRVIAGGLDRLPPALRVVAVLRDVQGLSAGEISRVLSLPERQVRERLHRARSRVRGELEAHLARKPVQEARA